MKAQKPPPISHQIPQTELPKGKRAPPALGTLLVLVASLGSQDAGRGRPCRDQCTSSIQGCAGMQLPARTPAALIRAQHGVGWIHTFCLLSSALFNIAGKPFPWSPMSWLTVGQGELPGQAAWQNSLTSARGVGILAFIPFTTCMKSWYLQLW